MSNNPKYTTEDAVIEMRSEVLRRTRYDAETDTFDTGVTVMQAYEMVAAVVNRAYPGRPPGTRINSKNEVVPIRAPRRESEPVRKRKMKPVNIDNLCAVDGDVSLAEMNDDIEVSPDDPVELTTGNTLIFVDDGEVGIVPELEQEPEWQGEDEVADEESEIAGDLECD